MLKDQTKHFLIGVIGLQVVSVLIVVVTEVSVMALLGIGRFSIPIIDATIFYHLSHFKQL